MGLPVSKGIGTGAAQVFEQDKTYQALQGMAGRKMQLDDYNRRLAEQKRKEEEEKAEKKKKATVKYQNIPYDTKGVLEADVPLLRAEFDKIQNQLKGRFHLVESDPDVANEYSSALADLNDLKNTLLNNKVIADKTKGLVNETQYDDYSDETRDKINKAYTTTGFDWAGLNVKKEKNFGDPIGKMAGEPSYSNIFYTPEYSNTTDKGTFSKTGKIFADEKTSLEEFKNRLKNDATMLENVIGQLSLNNEYEKDSNGEITESGMEQMYNDAYNLVKASLPESKKIVSVTEKEEEKEDKKDLGYNSKKWNANVQFNEDLNRNVVSFAPLSTSDSPLQLSGENVIVEGKEQPGFGNVFQLWTDNGKVKARIAMIEKDKDEEKVVNKVVTLQEDAVQRVKTIVGMNTSIDNFLKSIKPESQTKREGDKQDRLNLGI